MYVIFPADEVVYLSYGRVIYIPSRSLPEDNQHLAPARASYSSGSHVSYPSVASTSTNSSTKSRHSSRSLPAEPSRSQQTPNTNSLSSLCGSCSGKNESLPPVRPKRKKEFFRLPSLLSKSKPKTPSLERRPSFSDYINFTRDIREKSVDSVKKYSSDFEYQVSQKCTRQEQFSVNNSEENNKNSPTTRPSILKSSQFVGGKSNKSPCLMIRETDVFNFEQPSPSKARSSSASPKCNNSSNYPSRQISKSDVSVSNPTTKPVRKISSEKSPQIKVSNSDKSSQRYQREKTPLSSGKGVLTRSLSLKPNSSHYFDSSKFRASVDREFREITPPTNSSREKSPPSKTSDQKKLSKSFYNKPVKLLKKPLQISKSFKEIASPSAKTPSSPIPDKKTSSPRSLTVDFDSLFRRETSPAKVSLKNLAPKFEDENSRKVDNAKDKKSSSIKKK